MLKAKLIAVPVACNRPSVLFAGVRREGESPEPVVIQWFDAETGEIVPKPRWRFF
jgi:hypothetical protein